ncbi:MAG: SIS domain-containing protein, partial [Bacteroidetes bacterium]|nr:SIS domain-containing protein [Bacteroidota bacterium]
MNKSIDKIIELAKSTLTIEADSILNLLNYINNDFVACVQLIYESKGRVVVTGIGKSAIIAQKIVATFNSTGTPAIFMHAADAIHGDLGTLQQ